MFTKYGNWTFIILDTQLDWWDNFIDQSSYVQNNYYKGSIPYLFGFTYLCVYLYEYVCVFRTWDTGTVMLSLIVPVSIHVLNTTYIQPYPHKYVILRVLGGQGIPVFKYWALYLQDTLVSYLCKEY